MTATASSTSSLNDLRTGVIVGMVCATVIALFVLPLDFALNYCMNDEVTLADHLRFLLIVAISALGISAIHAGWVARFTHLPLRRSALGCLLISVSVFLFVGTGYAALSMSSDLDQAVGEEWSNAMCAVLASTQAVAAADPAGNGNPRVQQRVRDRREGSKRRQPPATGSR